MEAQGDNVRRRGRKRKKEKKEKEESEKERIRDVQLPPSDSSVVDSGPLLGQCVFYNDGKKRWTSRVASDMGNRLTYGCESRYRLKFPRTCRLNGFHARTF